MILEDIFKRKTYSFYIPSLVNNPDDKIGFYSYVHLYNYFKEEGGQSYHTLVDHEYREEYCLLINDSGLILESLSEYAFNYKIEDNLLTILVILYDGSDQPLEVPFIYDLHCLDTLYELHILLNQSKLDFFFLEMDNVILTIKHSVSFEFPENFIVFVKRDIERYLEDNKNNIKGIELDSEKEVVLLEDILATLKDDTLIERNFKKYNWVDVKEYAEKIFYNYGFEIPWAEDAWNILMFNSVVDSTNIVGSDHSDYEKGDIVLWLAALYDLYYEYKVAADYESSDGPTPMENVDRINDVEKYISVFLKGDIFEELNEQLSEGKCNQSEFYNVGMDTFLFTGYYDEPSIAYQVYCNEIKRRREIIEGIFYSHFKRNIILISEFMEGTHWCENYFSVEKMRQGIEDKYDKVLNCVNEGKIVKYNIGNSEYEYTDEDEVCKDLEYELEELENEIREYKSDAQTGRVYQWISNGMSF